MLGFFKRIFVSIFINTSRWDLLFNSVVARSSRKRYLLKKITNLVNTFSNNNYFFSESLSLYFARLNISIVGQTMAGELQKKVGESILFSDIQTLDSRHSGRYISNII